MIYYIHDIPGRLRIKSPLVKHNDHAEKEIADLLRYLSGIESIAVNTATGSFLIRYDPSRANSHDIVAALTEHGYFDPRGAITSDDYLRSRAAKFFSLFLPLLYPVLVEG